ncbi:MAG: [FeFe] hydrogenase, group A [Erysipelotrichaceae bacterium]|jgi:NADP-reducing hydrogenase subunit HndD|nr:[FeFe] hydrogenase, group A [Erysipelotrichaceae bacterium]
MKLVNIKIEGIPYQVEAGLTVLQAAKKCGYNIPTLCAFNDGESSLASCRVCLVEVKGARGLVASCVYPINEGMEIVISSPNAVNARRASVELILSNHNKNCQQCRKNGKCELLEVANITGARDDKYPGVQTKTTYDDLSDCLIRDTSKCILCGRCVVRCKQAQGIGILGFENRGFNTIVAPAQNRSFRDAPCINCGQCLNVCPTGALMEKDEIYRVDEALSAGKKVIIQTAPSVRATIAEEFGAPIGSKNQTGKMVAALHRLGFYRVFDTDFAADLTIMEEAHEFLHRFKEKGVLPMFTSCSPGWVNFLELFHPDLIPHASTCKSPHQMMGAIIKTYYAEKHQLDPKDLFVVSVMPCVSKKGEKERHYTNGLKDVDAVLTVRELARLIKRSGINWDRLPDEDYDNDLLHAASGAGHIFGVSGGVMEAALRTAYHEITKKEYDQIAFEAIRGTTGTREATLDINGTVLKVAVVSGMANAVKILKEVREGVSPYAFIEFMGCPGGCINGGGQPYVFPSLLPKEDDDILKTYLAKRASVLYNDDAKSVLRQSHNNPDIIKLYQDYLGKPNSHRAHELLHTKYDAKRERFPKIN